MRNVLDPDGTLMTVSEALEVEQGHVFRETYKNPLLTVLAVFTTFYLIKEVLFIVLWFELSM